MSRSGYSDDCENVCLWRQAVHRATTGYRGRAFLRKLRDALDAMPVKRLIAGAIKDDAGEVCALGAVDSTVRADDYHAKDLARHFGIAHSLAAEIVYVNDEYWRECLSWRNDHAPETPEERWTRVRAWVHEQLELRPSYDAVDPVDGITTG